jgi:hypothetical protein
VRDTEPAGQTHHASIQFGDHADPAIHSILLRPVARTSQRTRRCAGEARTTSRGLPRYAFERGRAGT